VFRVGYFMSWQTPYGKRGRAPHPHAWCRVGEAIVDITATQFGRFPAIYVVRAIATDRYVEHADGIQAIAFGRACGWPLTNLTEGRSAWGPERRERAKQKALKAIRLAEDRVAKWRPRITHVIAIEEESVERMLSLKAREASLNGLPAGVLEAEWLHQISGGRCVLKSLLSS